MRRADWSNARRSFEFGHAGCGALRIVLEFDGDDCSTTTANVSELQLPLEGAESFLPWQITFDSRAHAHSVQAMRRVSE